MGEKLLKATLATVDTLERTRIVREAAQALGFQQVGFARAEHGDPEDFLGRWLNANRHGDLLYMARNKEKRQDPRLLLPEAQSVIALGISYYRPEYIPQAPLKISRYAAGVDYHKIIRKRLRKLRKQILNFAPDAHIHLCIDTSAVLERAWAERAGIAWLGKSTLAIHPKMGTYFFIALLITSLEFHYDTPIPDRCGSCRRCLDACPTQAFAGPYQLDATRCITYWNVEPRPAEVTPSVDLHGWLAGCDVCQEVCPWNKFAAPAEDAFAPQLPPASAALWHDATHEEELTEKLAATTLKRTGARSLQANAQRILGLRDA